MNQTKAQWYLKNKRRLSRKSRVYYLKNKEIIKQRSDSRYKRNKKTILKVMQAYIRTPWCKHRRLLIKLREEKVSRRDLLWNFNFYVGLMSGAQCHYCFGSLNKTGHGLDCMYNEKGHICTNVVPCCWSCNKIKREELSYKDMMLLAPVLREIRGRQKGEL